MHPTITIGDHVIVTYHAAVYISLVTGFILSCFFMRRIGYPYKSILMYFLGAALMFFVSARLFNGLVNYDAYLKGSLSLFSISLSGFSVYGGILGGMVWTLVFCLLLKKSAWQLFDHLLIPFSVSFMLMRVGCFCNGCCYGSYTKLPFGIPVPDKG